MYRTYTFFGLVCWCLLIWCSVIHDSSKHYTLNLALHFCSQRSANSYLMQPANAPDNNNIINIDIVFSAVLWLGFIICSQQTNIVMLQGNKELKNLLASDCMIAVWGGRLVLCREVGLPERVGWTTWWCWMLDCLRMIITWEEKSQVSEFAEVGDCNAFSPANS